MRSVSKPGLLYANFQMDCDCGQKVIASFIGWHEDSSTPCPACRKALTLDDEQFDDQLWNFNEAVCGLFEKVGAARPSLQILDFIRKHNRLPTEDDLRKPEGYAVGLVGEQHYQDAIASCRLGDPVILYHEIDNPYDANAIVVINSALQTIGYIPRKNFVQKVVHKQGDGCAAKIFQLRQGDKGFIEVVLDVQIVDAPIAKRHFEPPNSRQIK